ncbi:MAG: ABC transporter permease [Hoeflea sp.]|uniref:ABC transporter permease n=1 Tax=Hoeflea sp. TaxID=1940281 RepID=UPI001DD7FC75|nr:ABC transporter permease [Hoeflea sp.]MBU4529823.1 ABC transporter permease [Alphaproteobacteria bacterium]MBU4547156.1 ABC transporter permease [Alphaproteobacteria bacterium]MBU4548769.1 ABC transporter permease [Alphaproteobacteria bacterium]MBV1722315.1 ABC transporter permease [Hoeflea sp.]MBV1762528.1 ABC transporter permease [Hoeflea sp.]
MAHSPSGSPAARLVQGLPAVFSVIAALAAWEVYVLVSGISPLVLPAPSRVAEQIVVNRDLLWANTVPTLQATLSGFAFSLSVAFALSLLIDFIPKLRRALFPVFVISQTLPLVAIAPLVVLWFGFGLTPKILLVALVTFFPMLVALVDGYESTDPDISALLKSMGASRAAIFRRARLPSAMPYFFAGLRISITYAVVAAIFAEYVGARAGLGIVILNAKNSFRPDLMLAAVVISSALTLALFGASALLQHLVLGWRRAGVAP